MTFRELEGKYPLTKKAESRKSSINHQKIIAVLFWAVVVGGYAAYAWINDMTPVDAVQGLADFLASPIGPLLFIVAYAVRPLLFFSATVLTIAAGSIFGPLWAIVLTVVASNLSAMVAYFVGRYFGNGFIQDDNATGFVQRYSKRLRQESFSTVMVMRLLFLPYDLVNYLCGFLKIEWKSFLLASAIGSIPGTISFVLLGASIDIRNGIGDIQLNPWALVGSVALILVSLTVSRYLRRRELNST